MNFGKLMGTQSLTPITLNASAKNIYYNVSKNNYFVFPSFTSSSLYNPRRTLSLCGGGLKRENKVVKASDPDVMMQTVEDLTKKRSQIEGHTSRPYTMSMIDINDLLFNEHRNYLIRYNDNQQVNAEELSGKIIVLYMVPLYYHSLEERVEERMATTHLIETYNYLLPHHAFEVVMVAHDIDRAPLHSDSQINNEKQFETIFSRMPWTAIPYADKTSRERICRRFGIAKNFARLTSFIIDSSGMLLQINCLSLFEEFGGVGYPFSNARLEFLNCQDDAIIQNPSPKMLLGSPERNYVISNRGDMVPLDSLEERAIALYFYEEGVTPTKLTDDIVMAYEEFSEKRKEFEVVLIYLYDTIHTCGYTSEESFYRTLTSMPWLALPFKDPRCRNLKRLFGHTDMDKFPSLVIIGPHGEFIEPWGAEILMKYKLPAYPFTREEVARIETERVKGLKLEMLWDPSTLFRRNDGTEVPFAQLAGKRIILFFEGDVEFLAKASLDFLKFLLLEYDDMMNWRGTNDEFDVEFDDEFDTDDEFDSDDEFEVIYISSGNSKVNSIYQKCVVDTCYSDSDQRSIADMTWLYARESDLLPMDHSLYRCCSQLMPADSSRGMAYCGCQPGSCATRYPTVLAFERDGRLVRKSIYLDSKFGSYNEFPFYDFDMDMEKEALMEITRLNSWRGDID